MHCSLASTSHVFHWMALGCLVTTMGARQVAGQPRSAWVATGADGKLVYRSTAAGDRIMDFSHAGYMGGGVALPEVPVKATVKPGGGDDDTAAIQAAVDQVAAMPLEHGFRGAVLLSPGTFTCAKTITVSASGVVLRGSGSGPGGTTIQMTGGRHAAVMIGLNRTQPRTAGEDSEGAAAADANPGADAGVAETAVTDGYVPSGATRFSVADATGFSVGDAIVIRHPTTPAWVQRMQMDTLKRDGRAQTWIGANRSGITERTLTAISGLTFTLDVPLADSYDAKLLSPPGTRVSRKRPEARVTQVGLEHLHFQCPPLEIAYGQAPYSVVRVGGDDCWLRDLRCEETMNSTTLAGKRITVQGVVVTHTFPNLGASKPTDFSVEGSQILIDRCRVTGDNEYFVWTGSLAPGPNVILNSTFRGHGSRIQPHQRWSTGLLVDNCTVPDGGIDFMNRGVAGSGHGWTMGWGVAWNCVAKTYIIQNPPGATNWAIGCIGARVQTARLFDVAPILPDGTFESHGTPVAPQSLYLAQLVERRGPAAARAIGYAENSPREFPDKHTPPLPALATDDDKVLGPDLALHRPVNTSDVRGRDRAREFGGERALDVKRETYWATNDGVTQATFEVDLEGPVEINALVLEEALGARVLDYKVEGQADSDWTLLARGTSIGDRKVERFPKATVWKVRLTIAKAESFIALRKLGLYLEPGR